MEILLYVLLTSLLREIRVSFSYDITNVSLEIQQGPAIFGQNFTIQCKIKNGNTQCDDIRQWYGGRGYPLLCEDGSCRNENKYIEKEMEACSYMLTISDLSENDLNCYYGCQYGFMDDRKELMMDESKFRYFPTNDDINLVLTTHEERSIKLALNVKRVFPKPRCHLDLTESDKITVLQEVGKNGSFYRMSFNATIPRTLLPGCNLRILCKIGERTVTLVERKLLECSSKDSGDGATGIVVAVVVPVILFGVSCVIYIFCCRKVQGKKGKLANYIDRYMPAVNVSWNMRKKNVWCINTEKKEQVDCEKDINVVITTEKELGHPTNSSSSSHCMTIAAEVAIINSVDMVKQLEPTIAIQNLDRSITDEECDDDNSISYPITADNLKDEFKPLLMNGMTQCKMDTSANVDGETLPLTGNCRNMPTILKTSLIENEEPLHVEIIDNKPVNTTTKEDGCLINLTSIPHCDANDCRMVDPYTLHSVEAKVTDMVNQFFLN